MEKEFLELQVDNYDKLCHKAKEIIFEGIITGKGGIRAIYQSLGIVDCVTQITPIEQILYFAVLLYKDIPEMFVVCPQKEIECNNHIYKADFYIEMIKSNKNIDKFIKLTHPIVIECDGYDYHSSKEQMQYDYNRENNLKLSGYNVIRFTGSQIYSQPKRCVEIIEQNILNALTNKEYKEE